MSAIKNYSEKSSKKSSSKQSLGIVAGILAALGIALFAYLMWYVSPEEVLERVQVIAITESGCIGETADGFAVNIGPCDAEQGQYVMAQVDQKVKERAAMMNPTK